MAPAVGSGTTADCLAIVLDPPVKTLTAAAFAALAIAAPAGAAQLLTNGDFDAGATGFYSAYSHAADHNLWGEGKYDTVSNPASTHRRFVSMADHTPGADFGRMMVVNGAAGADTVIWGQGDLGGGASLDGAAGAAFSFSFWMASVYPTSPANLQLWVNGAKVTGVSFAAGGGTPELGIWRQYGYEGVAGAGGLHSIALTNNNLAPFGNDFALDDMSLTGLLTPPPVPVTVPEPELPTAPAPVLDLPPEPPVIFSPMPEPQPTSFTSAAPEPGAWALMILGFGVTGAALRRRRARPFVRFAR